VIKINKIQGIYCIENLVNGKKYIGSSNNIHSRWNQHKRSLNKNMHHSILLQRAWNKYGENNFKFYILEVNDCNKKELFKREQYWMDYYLSYINIYGYNMSNNAICYIIKPATEEELILGKYKISYEQFYEITNYLINTNISIPKISDIVKVNERSIYQIYFKEQYTDITKDMKFKKRKLGNNSLLTEFDVKEIIIRLQNNEFNVDIARDYNVNFNTIDDIRHHRTWCYLTEGIVFDDISGRKRPMKKPVLQYDLNNNFIAEYESAREAEKMTSISYKYISRVCKGERMQTKGYVFKFKSN